MLDLIARYERFIKSFHISLYEQEGEMIRFKAGKMDVTCFIKKEGGQYASLCVELDVASCGRTKKDALDGLKRSVEAYIEYMVSEGREKEICRSVPMNELKTFLFPEHQIEEKTLKVIPLSFQYA